MKGDQKATPAEQAAPQENARALFQGILRFLQLFMTETIAKRVVAAILLAAGLSERRVCELADLGSRTVWAIKKDIKSGVEIGTLFVRKSRNGPKSKTADIEDAIVEELNTHNYQTRQQVVDMIKAKFNVTISVSTAGRILKKTASGS